MSNALNDFTKQKSAEIQPDVHFLAKLLTERFPEEVAGVDVSNPEVVIRLTAELLHRLWRWER